MKKMLEYQRLDMELNKLKRSSLNSTDRANLSKLKSYIVDFHNKGFQLEDGFIQADELEYVKDGKRKEIGIEIHSGRNRIVRRIFEHLGYKVEKLDRVYFAGLTKYNLPRGRWRHLTEQEVNALKMGAFE
jgi:16S rRNA U516 pseudouridylate synthase RsuA-like enzyme